MSSTEIVADALALHYQRGRLTPPGEGERWARVNIGRIPIVFPNLKARVRAIRLHDIHHVATGYQTDLRGEAEQSAWELGAGCHHHWFAWAINIAGVAMGMLACPIRTLRAFRHGRRSETLYRGEYRPEMLSETVASLRARLRIEN